jgi:N-formylglutamate amidohydrolase
VLLGVLFVSLMLAIGASVFADTEPSTQRLVTVSAGLAPIILAAPHGGREPIPGVMPRRGIGVPQFSVRRDNNTDELAERIAQNLQQKTGAAPFLVVARFERKYVDANRPREAAYESEEGRTYYDQYHRALTEACQRVRETWGRGHLLDIHGQGSEDQTIFRGTGNGSSTAALLREFGHQALTGEKSIFSCLERKKYTIAPESSGAGIEQRYIGGYTTQTYGSDRGTGIDAIQLEFGSVFRARANLDRTATDLAEAIVLFADAYLPQIRRSALGRLLSVSTDEKLGALPINAR